MKKYLIYIFYILIMGACQMATTGTPDFKANQSSNPTSPSFDSGEDTTRLLMGGGSLSRSGRWLWATGFENGVNDMLLSTTGGGAGSFIGISTDRSYQGKYSLKMQSPNVIGQAVIAGKYYHTQGARYGIEFNFSMGNLASPRDLYLSLSGPSNVSGTRRTGQVYLRANAPNDGFLFYLNSSGGFTSVVGQPNGGTVNNYIDNNTEYFHYIKLVFDTNVGMYVRLIFDNITFDLSGIAGFPSSSNAMYQTAQIALVSVGASNPVQYIDNLILTADEP